MSSNIHIPKTCTFCGKAFVARTTKTKNCGNSCAKKAYKRRKKEEKLQKAFQETKDNLQSVQTPQTTSTTPTLTTKEFLSVNEVSDLLGVSRWTIQRMIKRGDLAVKQMGRKKIVSRSQINNFFN